MPLVKIIDPDSIAPMPWLNGGGATREIGLGPRDATGRFRWRLSLAEVATAGPFSVFAGYRRRIAVIAGAGMGLTVGTAPRVALDPSGEPFRFSGDAATVADLVDGPVRDLNLITDAAMDDGVLVRITGPDAFILSETSFLFAVEGDWRLGGAFDIAVPAGRIVRLDRGPDEAPTRWLVEGAGRAYRADLGARAPNDVTTS